ncbi:MAG: OmpA family protein [Phycisphaerales bacterium]|nr:OmpA family protein [Phycisphaerales bacterium]
MSDHEHKEGEEQGHGGGGHGHGGGGHGHGGGGHEEHEGVPEWMISFADNTALMMGLFVILLAMNMGPKADPIMGGNPSENEAFEGANSRMLDWALGIREAFNNPVSIDSTNPNEAQLVQRLKQRKNPGNSKTLAPEGDAQNQQAVRPTDYTEIGGAVTFEDGSALLGSSARQTIAEVAEHIKGARWIVEVRGHVSPSETMRNSRKAMELSFERARAVAEQLVAQGVRWEQLRLGAAGDNERKVSRTYDREEDRGNQRVEIIVTKEPLPEDPFRKGAAKPAAEAPPAPEPEAPDDEPGPEPGGH